MARAPEVAAGRLADISRWRAENPDLDWEAWLDHLVEEYGCWSKTVDGTAVPNAARDFDRFFPASAAMQRTPCRLSAKGAQHREEN